MLLISETKIKLKEIVCMSEIPQRKNPSLKVSFWEIELNDQTQLIFMHNVYHSSKLV